MATGECPVTEPTDGKLRPLFRILAVCIGGPMLAFGLVTPFFVDAWTFSFAIKVIGWITLGAFFLHVGITGTNYYWKPETNDDESES